MASRIREMFSSKEDPVYYAQQQLHRQAGLDSRSKNYAYNQLEQHHGPLPIIELRVPMCCEKCKEKVQEELEDMEGVRTVVCDQFNQRVTVAGYADPLRVLKRVKKVKKKSEFFNQGSYINNAANHHHQSPSNHNMHHPGAAVPMHRDSSVRHTGQALVHGAGGPAGYNNSRAGGLTRTNSFGRERALSRQPSFGKVAHYNDIGLQRQVHEFESRDLQRDYYGVRRMPSFKKHRYHDAEYVSMGDQFTSAVPQQYHGDLTGYVGHHHSQRPVLQSQVSFSKLPVRNPYYVKPVYHEY